jgi:cell division septation protein DedD
MKKYFILFSCTIILSSSVTAKEISKEEKKRIKSQLREYIKHPESYQKVIDDYKETIDSNTVQLSQRKTTISQLTANIAISQQKMTDLESQLQDCKAKQIPVCPPCPDPKVIPTGKVYKIQVGLFKNLDISNYLNEPKYFGIEKSDDKNRYVISYFEKKEEAEKFATELKKLGIHGAFVAQYENGERVLQTNKHQIRSSTKITQKAASKRKA